MEARRHASRAGSLALSLLVVLPHFAHADGAKPPAGATPGDGAMGAPVTIPGVPGAYIDPTRPAPRPKRGQQKKQQPDEIRAAIKFTGHFLRTGPDTYEVDGPVTITFEDIEIRGTKLKADTAANTAFMPGRVEIKVKGKDATIVGTDMTFDMNERKWTFAQGDATLQPNFFPSGSVIQPVFVSGRELDGDDNLILGKRGRMTACDFPLPHYSMTARELRVIPEVRAVLKKVRFYYKDTVVASFPIYVIDLRPTAVARRRQALIPIFGQNDFEGKFLKFSLPLWAGAFAVGTGYLDLVEKRGTGFGLQNDYTFAKREGSIYAYRLADKSTGSQQLDTRLRHTERFSQTLTGTVSVDSTSNNQFQGAGSSITNLDLNLNRTAGAANSGLHLRREQFVSTFSNSSNTNASFRHAQGLGKWRTLDLNTDYRTTNGNSGFSVNEVNMRSEVTDHQKLLDLILHAELREDLDRRTNQGNTFVNALERAPEIMLRTDSVKLKRNLFGKMPMNATLSLGEFREYPENLSLDRIHFDFTAQDTTFKLVPAARDPQIDPPKLGLDFGGGFHQSFYSNSFARYIWNDHVRLNARPRESVNFSVDYSKQKPVGFTPFRFDFANSYESLDGTLSIDIGRRRATSPAATPTPPTYPGQTNTPTYAGQLSPYQALTPDSGVKLRLNFTTGYDVGSSQYRDLIMRAQYLPTRSLYMSASSGYDPNSGSFRDVVARLRIAPLGAFRFNTSGRYDPNSGKVTRINSYASVPLLRWWTLEALHGYNGFTRKSDFLQVRLRREVHDANVYLAYDHTSREFRLDFALKAFPAFDSRFGVGAQGQPLYGVGPGGELLGAGVGEIY